MKRRRVLSGSSSSSAGSSTSNIPVHFIYRNVCILCNESFNVGTLEKNPGKFVCRLQMNLEIFFFLLTVAYHSKWNNLIMHICGYLSSRGRKLYRARDNCYQDQELLDPDNTLRLFILSAVRPAHLALKNRLC